jgi:hypothetical protein
MSKKKSHFLFSCKMLDQVYDDGVVEGFKNIWINHVHKIKSCIDYDIEPMIDEYLEMPFADYLLKYRLK